MNDKNCSGGCVREARTEDSQRAGVILALADGTGVRGTAAALSCSTSYVQRWAKRFGAERLPGLIAKHQGRAVAKGSLLTD